MLVTFESMGIGIGMGVRGAKAALCFMAFLWSWTCGNGLLSPKGVNFEGKFKKFLQKNGLLSLEALNFESNLQNPHLFFFSSQCKL